MMNGVFGHLEFLLICLAGWINRDLLRALHYGSVDAKSTSFGPSESNKSAVSVHLYVEDVDTVFNKAVEAGAEVTMPITDMFWGDRFGTLKDPFGHSWSVATHTQDLTDEQIAEGAKNAFCDAPS